MAAVRHSQFNHLVKVPGADAWALYNFGTARAEVLDRDALELFQALDGAESVPERALPWLQAGFLTRIDELAFVRKAAAAHARAIGTGKVVAPLRLIVAPTNACNFACPYCFQENRRGTMTAQVADALVGFVGSRLATGAHRSLDVTWFGGEPMLALDVMESLSERLFELARSRGIAYRARIDTNGYLFDQKNVCRLERMHVSHAMITIDGVGAAHDATRPLAGGGGTYARIMGNLERVRTGMSVNVRYNVHAGNVEHVAEVAERVRGIAERNGVRIRLSLNEIKRGPTNKDRPGMVECASPGQMERARRLAGIPAPQPDCAPQSCACPAAHLNGLFVDPFGDVYPECNTLTLRPDASLGNVVDWGGHLPRDWGDIVERVIAEYLIPDDSPACLACKFLPCCYGACRERRRNEGAPACPQRFADPDAYVLGRVTTGTGECVTYGAWPSRPQGDPPTLSAGGTDPTGFPRAGR